MQNVAGGNRTTTSEVLLSGKEQNTPASAPVMTEALTNTEALKELLISYGQKPTTDKTALMATLAEAGLPSDKASFLKLNQIFQLFNLIGTEAGLQANIDKAVFALKNDLPTNMDSVKNLHAFLSEGAAVSKNIDELFLALSNAPKNAAIEQIIQIFSENSLYTGRGQSSGMTLGEANNPVPAGEGFIGANQGAVIAGGAVNTMTSETMVQTTSVNQLNFAEIFSALPTEGRAEFLQSLAETLGRAESMNNPSQALKAAAEHLTKVLNLSQPLSEAEAFAMLSLISKEMPEAGGLLNNLVKGLSSPPVTVASPDKVINFEPLERAFENMRLSPFENDRGALEEVLNSLKYKTEEAIKVIAATNEEIPAALTKSLENINNNLSFMDQLKTCVYVPIPLNTHLGHAEGELYIFKDGRAGGSKGAAKTALIGLNTVSLGRVEAYIHKDENRLNLQFRLGEIFAAELISKHHKELVELLESAGLKLLSLSSISLSEPFSMLDNNSVSGAEIKLSEHRFDIKA